MADERGQQIREQLKRMIAEWQLNHVMLTGLTSRIRDDLTDRLGAFFLDSLAAAQANTERASRLFGNLYSNHQDGLRVLDEAGIPQYGPTKSDGFAEVYGLEQRVRLLAEERDAMQRRAEADENHAREVETAAGPFTWCRDPICHCGHRMTHHVLGRCDYCDCGLDQTHPPRAGDCGSCDGCRLRVALAAKPRDPGKAET